MNLGEIIRSLRVSDDMTQKELADKLSISPSTIGMYEQGRREPDLDTISKIANYFNISIDRLLGREDAEERGLNEGDIEERRLDGPGLTDILGYSTNEEKATLFSHKLALQIDINGVKLSDVANAVGVPIDTIVAWLNEKSDNYSQYYKELSEYFKVIPSYWTRPGAISPGIEPTTQEYILVLRYRNQNDPELIKYTPIEDFFSNCHELSESEFKWLQSFRQLNEDNQDIIIGKIKEYLKEQRHESVAADAALKQNETDNQGKFSPSSGTEGDTMVG